MKFRLCSVAVLSLLAFSAAHAGQPPKVHTPAPKPRPARVQPVTVDTSVYTGSQAGAAALSGSVSGSSATGGAGGAGGAGGDAVADSYSEGSQATGIGDVDVGGDVSRYRSTAIALSVPGATAAPAVPGECLKHSRGWQAGMGLAARSGGTEYDPKQCDRAHCLAIADRFQAAGLLQAMADQLATCGGVPVRVVVAPPPAAAAPPPAVVTPEQLAELERRMVDRMDRQAARGIGK